MSVSTLYNTCVYWLDTHRYHTILQWGNEVRRYLKLISGNLASNQIQSLLSDTSNSATTVGGNLSDFKLIQSGAAVSQHRARSIVVVSLSGTTSTNDPTKQIKGQKQQSYTSIHFNSDTQLKTIRTYHSPVRTTESDLQGSYTHTGLQVDLSGNGS